MTTLSAQWQAAKTDFESLTGKKKPKPNGLIAKTFNSSGLTGAIKTADEHIDKMDWGAKDDDKTRAKVLGAAEKHIKVLSAAAKSYIDTLDKAAKDEIAEEATKTLYAKALKLLRDQLKLVDHHYVDLVNTKVVSENKNMKGAEKILAFARTSLDKTMAVAVVAMKSVKARPTAAEFNKHFNTSDPPPRKIQVQLIAIEKAIQAGLIKDDAFKIRPKEVADALTPWQAGGKGKAVMDDGADERAVLVRLGEFAKIYKDARSVAEDLK